MYDKHSKLLHPFTGNLVKIYPQMQGFRSGQACERWISFINACLNNREEVDMQNIPGVPAGYNASDVRKMAYIPGLITLMRATDITNNTVVKNIDDNIINPGTLNVYYSSFFDDVGGVLTHKEEIIDFYTQSARSITFTGVSNRTSISSSTSSNVIRYDTSGLNPSFDINTLNFKGYYNEGNSTDITQDHEGNTITTITFSKKCLFIPFIEDMYANSLTCNGYTFYSDNDTTIRDAVIFERAAFNTSSTQTYSETLPTWIYKQDYDIYKDTLVPNTTNYGSIVYAAQGVDRSPNDKLSIGTMASAHLNILRAINGSSITLAELQDSTFLKFYDDNGLGGDQNYASLTALNTAASGKLLDNTDHVNYNNLASLGVTAIYNYGDFLPSNAAWDSGTTYTLGQKVNYNDLEYTSLSNSNQGNQPDISSSDWKFTQGKGLMASISTSEFNSQITTGINNLL